MVVNLNAMCKVKLNDFGKVIWLSQIDNLSEEAKNNHELIETLKNKVDANGYIELELWGIMNIFGPYISQATSPFVSQTIQLNKNPNFIKNKVE